MTDKGPIPFRKYVLPALLLVLLASNAYVFSLLWRNAHRGLTFAMLDIGQGDGLFIESPTGTQLLIDAGPVGKIPGELPQVMNFFDKKIDAVIITNPDADHIGGFLDVLKTYKVNQVFEPGTFNDSDTYKNLEAAIKNKNIPDTLVRRGMQLDLGGGAFIDILFPDRDVSSWTTNDGSVVAKLTYGNTSVMLTGDATSETEKIVLAENSANILHSNILKVGHHGSRTSTSPEFVQAVAPFYAVISDGKNNRYGHPHQETLDTLAKFNTQIFRTDLLGSIFMKSDGQRFDFSFHK